MEIAGLDTPCVLVDVDIAANNLSRAQAYADQHGLKLRPHIKTHKMSLWAERQLKLGAVGITCQKLGEAEVMADAGISDILISYNIIGKDKLARLKALNERISIAVCADNLTVLQGYSQAFSDPDKPLRVLIECDTGAARCGVQSSEQAMDLAQFISSSAGLEFEGLMTYPPIGKADSVNQFLSETQATLTENGMPAKSISSGGSPELYTAHKVAMTTEYRPGTYIYSDRMQVSLGMGSLDDCALSVLSTVVSNPTYDRVILDAGSKILAADMCLAPGCGHIIEYPKSVITSLNEEHAMVDMSACDSRPKVGDKVRIIPNHSCVVSNLVDVVQMVNGIKVLGQEDVSARGKSA